MTTSVWKIVASLNNSPFRRIQLRSRHPLPEGTYFSCRARVDDGGVKYVPEQWTTPNILGSRLFAFDSLYAAQNFELEFGTMDDVLFLAEAEHARPQLTVCQGWTGFYEWWNGLKRPQGKDAPLGTVGCRAIKLTMRIPAPWHHPRCECGHCALELDGWRSK